MNPPFLVLRPGKAFWWNPATRETPVRPWTPSLMDVMRTHGGTTQSVGSGLSSKQNCAALRRYSIGRYIVPCLSLSDSDLVERVT